MTFYGWIMQYKGCDTPRGDLADDVARDKSFPVTDDYETILEHIELHAKIRSVVPTFKRAWASYQKSQSQ